MCNCTLSCSDLLIVDEFNSTRNTSKINRYVYTKAKLELKPNSITTYD